MKEIETITTTRLIRAAGIAALVAGALFLRSAIRGQRIQWKGRTYRVGPDPPG